MDKEPRKIVQAQNIFKNIDLVTGFVVTENIMQCVDQFFVFTDRGYIQGEIHQNTVEL